MIDTIEVLGLDPQDEVEAKSKVQADVSNPSFPTQSGSPAPRKSKFQAITAGPSGSSAINALEKPNKKRKGLTPEQKQRLEAMQKEQENIRNERVALLSQTLLEKISVWAETDRSNAVTEAFKNKIQVIPPHRRLMKSMKRKC